MPLLNAADAVYLGATPVDRVYLGSTLVWEPASQGFDFASVPGLWLDWDPAVLALADNDPIDSWADSHSGLVVSQATAAKRPVYKASGPNGKSYVRGDGVDDFLRSGAVLTSYSGHVTHFIVYKPHTATPASDYLLDIARDHANIIAGYEPNGMVEFYRSSVAGFPTRFNAGTSGTASWAVHELVTGASANQGYRNSALIESVAAQSVSWASGTTLTLLSTETNGEYGQADIARLLTYKASVSDPDRANIRAELGRLYGIPMGTVVLDSFDRPDSTDLGTADTGQAWTVSGDYDITANQAAAVTNGSSAWVDSGVSDATITADIRHGADNGISFRILDGTAYLMARLGANKVEIYRRSGTFVQLDEVAMPLTVGQTYAFKISFAGTAIDVFVDDVLKLSVSSTFQLGLTNHGLYGSPSNSPRWDNFRVDAA